MAEDLTWIRVMADYSSTGLWLRNGASADTSQLPVSESLHQRLAQWCRVYESNDDDLPTEDRCSLFNVTMFAVEGRAIAQAIKAERPEWTVVYYDEAQALKRQPGDVRDTFEYEV